jgi:rRNA maturation endonuclease Nob1
MCGSHYKNDDVTLQNTLLINVDLENVQRNKKKKIKKKGKWRIDRTLCMASLPLEVCDLTTIHILI